MSPPHETARSAHASAGAPESRVFVISVAAQLAGMHPQTLRQYDRLGLVSPQRTGGGGRRYSDHDVVRLREVQRLSQEEGVNLAGIKRIIELENQVAALQQRVAEVTHERDVARTTAAMRGDLLPMRSTAMVVWRPER